MQPWHDEHIGWSGQAAERIILHDRGVERGVRSHLTLIFEIDIAAVEHLQRVADIFQMTTRRVAEVGIGEEGDARVVTHAARDGDRAFGNVGKFTGGGAFVHRGVGEEHRLVLRHHDMDAKGGAAHRRVHDAFHFTQSLREGPGHASDHRIGMTHADQQGAKDIPVPVDHPLAIAPQMAAPLQP